MFLKSLIISSRGNIIRNISFRKGINLIIDENYSHSESDTGNNIGKTTVLKLIDMCLGADSKIIFTETENKNVEHTVVKNFLTANEVLITLVLKENLDDKFSNEIVIEKNFLKNSKAIRKINGKKFFDKDFNLELSELIFTNKNSEKPTFRQIISHNFRYSDIRISNTLKVLDQNTTDAEYETLYLYLFGCDFSKGNLKQEILSKIRIEEKFKKRIEKNQTKTAYESALFIIESEIEELNKKKLSLNLNPEFENDLNNLNLVKFEINKISSEVSNLKLRKEIIIKIDNELKNNTSKIDLVELKQIYQQANSFMSNLHNTFQSMVSFHNTMLEEKRKFITHDLPKLNEEISKINNNLSSLLVREHDLTIKTTKTDTFEDLEKIIIQLNEKYKQKGEYEAIIKQISESEQETKRLNSELKLIDEEIFSDDFEFLVKHQVNKFNKHFSYVSDFLYSEKYAIKYDISTNKQGKKFYKFSTFNANMSSGKKQGEIFCFDIAYSLFADAENIPCFHFLLNDKKELVHDNQLLKIAKLVEGLNIQFVASILKDKLPVELNNDKYFILKLSSKDKLFKIEKF